MRSRSSPAGCLPIASASIFVARRTEAPLPFDGLTTLSVDGLDDNVALRLLAELLLDPR